MRRRGVLARARRTRRRAWRSSVAGLLAAEALDTLPARDAKARPLGGTTLKGLDERRLPYAGLARDEDDLSVTSPRLLETGLEQGPWSIAAHHGRGPRGQAGGRVAACLEHGRDELIAALGKGLDERRPVGSVAQGLPDFQDVFLDDLRIDVSLRPDGLQDLFLCHQPIGMLDQEAEHVERLRRQR